MTERLRERTRWPSGTPYSLPFPLHLGQGPSARCQPPGADGSGHFSLTCPDPSQRVHLTLGAKLKRDMMITAAMSTTRMTTDSGPILASSRFPPLDPRSGDALSVIIIQSRPGRGANTGKSARFPGRLTPASGPLRLTP